jgi:hypothetical protein
MVAESARIQGNSDQEHNETSLAHLSFSLRTLRLQPRRERTKRHLKGLKKLEWLNLYRTQIGDRGLKTQYDQKPPAPAFGETSD